MPTQVRIQPILNALHVFEQAARLGSFTRAAEKLGMAQPSVSRFVSNLEDHLGAQLFHRQHNRIALTVAGEALYKATSLGLGHIQEVMDNIARGPAEQGLTIACTHGFAHMWVLPKIDQLRTLLPGVDIRLSTSDQPRDPGFDEVDIAIRFGNGSWSGVETLMLFKEEVFPICSPAFLTENDMQPSGFKPEMLNRLPLLVQDHGEFGWMSWADWFRAACSEAHLMSDTHPVQNYQFILQAAMEGRGVALGWDHLVEPYLANGWLVELPGARVKTENGYYATYSTGHPFKAEIAEWVENCQRAG